MNSYTVRARRAVDPGLAGLPFATPVLRQTPAIRHNVAGLQYG